MEKTTQEQFSKIFMDYVAECFDREDAVYPDEFLETDDRTGGGMSVRRAFELARLGK